MLPNYMGIIISQYKKDPYKPIIIMECHKGFERCSIETDFIYASSGLD